MLKHIDKHNFCQYVSLVNLLSYNFGYHVHEKAFMMVTIPMGLVILQKQFATTKEDQKEFLIDISRFRLFRLFLVWSLWAILWKKHDFQARAFLMPLDYLFVKLVLDYQLKKVSNKTSVDSTRKKVYDTFWWIITIGWIFTFRKTRENIVDRFRDWYFDPPVELRGINM